MTISLPGSNKGGLAGLFGRKKAANATPVAKKQLNARQMANLFDKEARAKKPVKPAKLSETEKNAGAQLTSLRGALYADD